MAAVVDAKAAAGSATDTNLKAKSYSQLRGKGHADCRAGAEEVSQRATGQAQVFAAAYRPSGGAICVEADVCYIASLHLAGRHRKRPDVRNKIVAGILPVQQIEKFYKGSQGHPLIELEVAREPQVNLSKRHAAKFIERSLPAIYYCAIVDHPVAIDVHGRS